MARIVAPGTVLRGGEHLAKQARVERRAGIIARMEIAPGKGHIAGVARGVR